ncbi:MAG: GatB/YqeY domain-containing protein [Nitrospira sp.]|nr:GatB/YqeY domain-containing protein [bacterium]MBL7048209.1 GatB/YqeY domain-containing protein [Nitrospira sp.]
MSISDKLSNDLKNAMKSGDKEKLSILRMIISALKNIEIESREKASDDDTLKILRSFQKRAKDSINQFSTAGRTDLADKEKAELAIITGYLPSQLSEDDIINAVREAADALGATGPADMGKVMREAMTRLKGQADGKLVNTIVKQILEAR